MFSRLTTTKTNRIFLCFGEDLTATATAKIAGVNRNTVNRYFTLIREKIVKYSIAEYNRLMNTSVAEKLHFEAKTIPGKRLKRLLEKRPVLGLLKREKKIFITILHTYLHENLFTKLRERLLEYGGFENGKSGDTPLQLKEYDQYRVFCKNGENIPDTVVDTNDEKSIDNFLTFAKKRLAKFNGCSQDNLFLHLKECEFRYNHREEDIFKLIKKIFQKY